ncbi:PAS domain S-box protein [Pseudorhodoferax sp.]|uniref:sensor histidine kinase n=1 Tax=Pseudorhodoferax sp. TaxID=1993553 RepID=UPI0039E39B8E
MSDLAQTAAAAGLLAHARDGVIATDAAGRVVAWNPAAERLLGWPPQAALGRPLASLLALALAEEPAAGALVAGLCAAAARGLDDLLELPLRRRDGSVATLELSAFALPDGGAGLFLRDISGRRSATRALRDSEARYRAVVEHMGQGMAVIQDGRVAFWNARALQIMDLRADQADGADYLPWLHPDDRRLAEVRQRARQRGDRRPRRGELRRITADGRVRWLDVQATAVPWDGRPAMLVFFSDVTEAKATREALRASEERMRAVVEHAGEGMVVVQRGRFVFANRRALQIAGRTREQLIGRSLLEPVHPDDRALLAGARRRVPARHELRLAQADGSATWIEIGVTRVPWDGRHALLGFFSDVGPRMALQARLRETLAERETILNHSLVGIAFNVGRRFRWVNDKLAELTGYSREELTGASSRLLYPDEESHRREGVLAREHLSRDGRCVIERQLVRKNGERLWVQMAGRCLFGRDPEAGTIWTCLDITDRKRAEDHMRAALARQQELNALRSRFVAMTSHEFRTPLATILSSADLVAHYGERMPPAERADVLRGIASAVQRMTRMLDRMLLIGRADAQLLECQPQPLDLAALCRHCAEEVRAQYPARAADVVVEYACASAVGDFDERLLRHVLTNLLSNAVKYSPGGGPVRLAVRDQGARRVIEVSDSGIGIPAGEQAHLFETFHRASNVGDIPGTGLGLAIVRKALEAHGGTIEVHSRPGRGSCFRVVL